MPVYNRYSLFEIQLFSKGVFLSIIFRLIIQFVPFKYLSDFINWSIKKNNSIEPKEKNRIALRTIRRISKRLPWARNCFVKSLTLKYILNEIGIKSDVILSINQMNGQLIAHAYVATEFGDRYFYKNQFCDIYILKGYYD